MTESPLQAGSHEHIVTLGPIRHDRTNRGSLHERVWAVARPQLKKNGRRAVRTEIGYLRVGAPPFFNPSGPRIRDWWVGWRAERARSDSEQRQRAGGYLP